MEKRDKRYIFHRIRKLRQLVFRDQTSILKIRKILSEIDSRLSWTEYNESETKKLILAVIEESYRVSNTYSWKRERIPEILDQIYNLLTREYLPPDQSQLDMFH